MPVRIAASTARIASVTLAIGPPSGSQVAAQAQSP